MVNPNKSVLEKLNTIYIRVFQLQDLRQVLLSIYEYIDTLDITPELSQVYESIQKTATQDMQPLKELEEKALQETAIVYKKLKEYVEKEAVADATILEKLRDYEGSVAGTYTTSLGELKERHGSLCYALMCLVELNLSKHLEFCRKYGVITDNGRIVAWNFSPAYAEWLEANEKMKRQELTKVWYSWNKLVAFYQVYKDYEGIQSMYIKDGKFWDAYGLSMLYDEIKFVMEGKEFNSRVHREFILGDYKIYLERVHTYVIAFTSTNIPEDNVVSDWSYAVNTLTINNKTVDFRQGLRRELLNFLTKSDKSKKTKYLFADIHLKIGDSAFNTKQGIPKLREACKGINETIASKTGITSFLKYDTLEVQINPKYLS